MARYSVIIPAYNEAAFLPRLLDSIDVARNSFLGESKQIDIVVANNSSSDATEQIARERGCRVANVAKRSIAAARNGGAAIATGEVLCFVDADTVLDPQTFNTLEQTLGSGDCVGGATGWILERSSVGLQVTRALVLALTRLAGVGAGLIFCRAELFQQIGGYNEDRQYAEDVEFFRAMVRLAKREGQTVIRRTSSPAVVSTRKFDTHGDWHMFRMFLWIPFRYGSMKNLVQAYWYDDKERF